MPALVATAILSLASNAFAQWSGDVDHPTSRVELSASLWLAPPSITAAGERGGVRGTTINFNDEFGLPTRITPVVDAAFHPGRRHRLRAVFAPLRYVTTATLTSDITFAGTVYPRGIPATATISWAAFEGSYAFDLVSRKRVRFGLIGEIDRTNIEVRLQNAGANNLTTASTPTIPAGGATFGYRFAHTLTFDGEFLELYVPDRPNQIYGGHYTRVAARFVLAVAPHIGATAGFRMIDIRHQGLADSGTMRLPGVTAGIAVWR